MQLPNSEKCLSLRRETARRKIKMKSKKNVSPDMGFKPKNLKIAGIISAAVFFALVLFQITVKIIKSSKNIPETVYTVNVVNVKEKNNLIYTDFSAVAQGVPQIKIFSPVAGKFISALKEGTAVNKGDAVVWVDRDIPGMDYKAALVTSPISGIVTRIYFKDKGEIVTPYMPAAEISGMNEIKTIISAGSSFMSGIKPGKKADIILGEKFIRGEVTSITPFISKDDMAVNAAVTARNESFLIKPGEQVKVRVYIKEKKSIFIPDSALFNSAAGEYVFVIKDERAVKVFLKTGHIYGRLVEITEGLKEGDLVATEGSFKLMENAKVKIIKIQE